MPIVNIDNKRKKGSNGILLLFALILLILGGVWASNISKFGKDRKKVGSCTSVVPSRKTSLGK